jgi:hypothetical protein
MELVVLFLAFCAGICRASYSKLVFHFETSVFADKPAQWDPRITFAYKYRNHDPKQGPKFWGATTVLVWMSDPYHRFQAGFLLLYPLAAFLAAMYSSQLMADWILLLVLMGLEKVTFELFFSELLAKE